MTRVFGRLVLEISTFCIAIPLFLLLSIHFGFVWNNDDKLQIKKHIELYAAGSSGGGFTMAEPKYNQI